jgi:ABC-type sugar transport system ATPase subunit
MRRGWALIPESRREQGLMMDWSIARNTVLLVLEKLLNRLGLIDQRQVRATTAQFINRFSIATDRQDKKVADLSGGNQQKVLLAKWLATGPAILILNDPTRGVDVGAKDLRPVSATRRPRHDYLNDLERAEEIAPADRVFIASRQVLHESIRRNHEAELCTRWQVRVQLKQPSRRS